MKRVLSKQDCLTRCCGAVLFTNYYMRKITSKEDENLPSVRMLAKELKISALTVKKAYDALEQEGFIVTVHGKGSFVSGVNQELRMEEKRKEVETDLEQAIRKARSCGMTEAEIRELFELILED